jgi:protein phosphatase
MAKSVGLEFAAKTDTGLVRSHNEDAITYSPEYGFAILADGMGGYNAGEVASGIAISATREVLERELEPLLQRKDDTRLYKSKRLHQVLADSIQGANSAILEAARAERQYEGMGTTIVAALFHQDRLIVAHVGDSRAYRYRGGQLEQITRDHSLLQEQIDAGLIDPEWAPYAENKNLVTRAVGIDAAMEVEIHDHQTEAGDIYLLCSDGLSDLLSAREITAMLAVPDSLDAACDALVKGANENGGRDNISVILIRIQSISENAGGLIGRLLGWMK